MVDERLQLIKQGNIAQSEEIGRLAEIAIDQSFDAQVIMPVAFFDIALKSTIAARFDRLQLRSHGT